MIQHTLNCTELYSRFLHVHERLLFAREIQPYFFNRRISLGNCFNNGCLLMNLTIKQRNLISLVVTVSKPTVNFQSRRLQMLELSMQLCKGHINIVELHLVWHRIPNFGNYIPRVISTLAKLSFNPSWYKHLWAHRVWNQTAPKLLQQSLLTFWSRKQPAADSFMIMSNEILQVSRVQGMELLKIFVQFLQSLVHTLSFHLHCCVMYPNRHKGEKGGCWPSTKQPLGRNLCAEASSTNVLPGLLITYATLLPQTIKSNTEQLVSQSSAV